MIAITYGNFAQWISAVVAVVAVLAAGVLLLHGRRTDADLTAESLKVDGQLLLDVRVGIRPVGSLATHPYPPLPCQVCDEIRQHDPAGKMLPDEAWFTFTRCFLEDTALLYESRDIRWPTVFRHGSAMKGRRSRWGCPNRKVSTIEIREVRRSRNEDGKLSLEDVSVRWVVNALRSQFSEPHERAEATHIIPIDNPDSLAIGWRVVFTVQIPMETWFFRRPNKDSWRWIVDDFVPLPE